MDHLKFNSLIKSDSLKEYIKDTNHIFSEYELLIIAFKYANNYNERLELLKYIQDNSTTTEVNETAAELIPKTCT
jgi:hypothetical protein